MVSDLKSSNRLAEEEREASQVGVTAGPGGELSSLFRRVLGILHVEKVIFALYRVLVNLGEEVFREFQCYRKQNEQRVKNVSMQGLCADERRVIRTENRSMSYPSKFFNLLDVLFDDGRVYLREVPVEFCSRVNA